jgi:hypothetical protein
VSRSYERALDVLYARVYNLIAERSPARWPRKTLVRASNLIPHHSPARLPRKTLGRTNDLLLHRGPARWSRKTLAAVLILAVAVAAAATWLKVARTIRHPEPVSITKQPRVNALAWSGRVFVDAASFKRWLEARDGSYAVWARRHPRAVAILERQHASRR